MKYIFTITFGIAGIIYSSLFVGGAPSDLWDGFIFGALIDILRSENEIDKKIKKFQMARKAIWNFFNEHN